MPAKNSIKDYEAGAYYHIYNRGVERRKIFLDDQDYKTFLSYLKLYLIPQDLQGSSLKVSPSRRLKNYADEIDLLCYCLMPNHFHLLVKQSSIRAIRYFMSSLCTKYSMYFNKKYNRVGRLFQGIYKAAKISSEDQLLYLTKYIHLNPRKDNLINHSFSSLQNYLGRISQQWIRPQEVLSYFSKSNQKLTYESFIEISDSFDLQGSSLQEGE